MNTAHTDRHFYQQYGDYALVTGAARGLGKAFAHELAHQGFNLVLLDVLETELATCKQEISAQYGTTIISLVMDLTATDLSAQIDSATKDLDIGLLVSNAGIAYIGPFLEQDETALLTQFKVNAQAGLILCHYFGQRFKSRQQSGMILVSSGAAQLPSANNANYASSKALLLNLAESLWLELKPDNIDVLGFMPPSTNTEGMQLQGYAKTGGLMPADQCVKEALHFLGKRSSVIAGRKNRIIHTLLLALTSKHQRIKIVSAEIKKLFNLA